MTKLTMKASELTDADINLVSMVKRGANRVPFRMIKSEGETTMDLYALARRGMLKSDTAAGHGVVAVLLAKAADTDQVRDLLKTAGIDTKALVKNEKDGLVSFAKAEIDLSKADEATTCVVALRPGISVVIKGEADIVKAMQTYDWDSTDFPTTMAKGSFAPSLHMAGDMLHHTMHNIMQKSGDGKELASKFGKALDDHKAHVLALAKGLPKDVFKAEELLRKEEISANPAVDTWTGRPTGHGGKMDVGQQGASNDIEGNPVADGSGGNGANVKGGKMAVTSGQGNNDIEGSPVERKGATTDAPPGGIKKEGENKIDVTGGNAAASDLDKDGKRSGAGAAAAPDFETIITKSLETAADKFGKLIDAKLAPVTKSVDDLQKQVKKSDEALQGTVLGHAQGDRNGIQKAGDEDGDSIPLLDTSITPMSIVEKQYNSRRH